MAKIRRLKTPVSSSESAAAHICGTVSLDTFIQVVGLVINTCDSCPTGEVFIATYMESIIIQDCDFSNMDSWTVYDMSSRRSDTHIAGDMFVFTKDNKLLITASVVRFTLYGISKLEKVLQGSKIDISRPAEPLSLTPKVVTRGEVGGSGAKVKIYDHDHNYEDETMVATEAVSIETTKKLQDDTLGKFGSDSFTSVGLANQLCSQLEENAPQGNALALSALAEQFLLPDLTTTSVTVWKRISRTRTRRAVL